LYDADIKFLNFLQYLDIGDLAAARRTIF